MKLIKYQYVALAAIISFAATTSCDESLLDKQPQSPLEPDYFKTEQEMERGIWAIYSKMNAQYSWNAGEAGNFPGSALWQLPGDDLTTAGNGEAADFETFNSLSPANGIVNRYYKACYELIGRANTMIEKIDESQGVFTTPGLKESYKGEALFLRGYTFFNLWNFFEIAPLITKRPKGAAETLVSPSSGTQLLDQAIQDVTEAAGLLPTSWSEENRGRVTKNSAYGMLGKFLLFRGDYTGSTADYTAAVNAFNQISGVSLVARFDDNHAATTENNAESLFEYQASQPSFDNIWLPDEFNNDIGTMSTASWLPFEGINSWGYGGAQFIATQKLRNAFEPGDPRLPLTLDATTGAIRKYVSRDQKNQVAASSLNNPRILRYADVLLMRAEAILLSGGSKTEAIGLINQVRARARNMVPGGTVPADLNTGEASNQVIMQWIMDERLRELAAEETIRWFDIKRWNAAGRLTLNDAFFASTNTNFRMTLPRHLYLPIPLNETDRNPNMRQKYY